MAKLKTKRWGIYKSQTWGKTLLGRVRANSKDAAGKLADQDKACDGWDIIEELSAK